MTTSPGDRVALARMALASAEWLKDTMTAVATGGPRIETVNADYRRRRQECRRHIDALGLTDPNPFDDLWGWYGRWTNGDYPSYQSRREYLGELWNPLLAQLQEVISGRQDPGEVTGWTRVDRGMVKMREAMRAAQVEEDYQSVGLFGRETLISLAEAVYVKERHPSLDGTPLSNTDVKRKLDAFIAVELVGATNESVRRHARLTFELANELTHKRTATFQLAAHCTEAVRSACEHIAIAAGRRTPGFSP